MRKLSWTLWCCLAGPAAGQVFIAPASRQPATTDLNSGTPCPFMFGNARMQQFLAASEIGTGTLMINRVQLRYDGPPPAAAPRVHQIQQLTLRIGVTARSVNELGADFAANLTQPLGAVLDHVPWQFDTDSHSQTGPETFGGPNGSLSFALPGPLLVSVPAGGALALELLVEGNGNTAADGAALDFQDETASAISPGAAITNGTGCPAAVGAPLTRLLTQGLYAPGTAIALFGDGYPTNAPVVTFVTAHLLGQRIAIPGSSPTCWFYLDLATGGPMLVTVANSAGVIEPGDPGVLLPVPRSPSFCGALLYVQNVALAPANAGNPLGINTSNYRAIGIGCTGTASLQAWFAANPQSASASVASFTAAGSVAIRID